MRSGFALSLLALVMVACAPSNGDDSAPTAASDLDDGSSPLDQLTYSFKLTLRKEHYAGCNLVVAFHTAALNAGYQSEPFSTTTAEQRDGVLEGEFTAPRYERFTTVRVTTWCGGDELADGPPGEKRYLGESKVDFGGVKSTPGPRVDVPLSKAGVLDAAGLSLKVGVTSVTKGAPVPDTNCAALGNAPANRFFVRAQTLWGMGGLFDEGDDYVRTITIDGDSAKRQTKLRLDKTEEWFTYCRAKAAGHADAVNVKVDLVEKDLLEDDHFDSGDGATVKVGEEATIEHHSRGGGLVHTTKVLVIR